MKHIFIINPIAGNTNAHESIRAEIDQLGENVDAQIYLTQSPGDATQYIRNYCQQHSEPVRFYACGGDGTLHEVANGVAGFPFAAIGCYPCGSGNDFVKYYGGSNVFKNLKSLVEGQAVPIDLIRANQRYAINAVHFGFDSCVATHMTKLRRTPIVGGKNAYPSAIAIALVKGMKTKCTIEADGNIINPNQNLLLCTLCNGQYVGGSYRCAPRSHNDDGKIELCLANPVSHFRFLQIMTHYKHGTHLDDPRFDDVFIYQQVKQVRLTTSPGFIYAMDGELFEDTNIEIEIAHKATHFVIPQGAKRIEKSLL